jgi:hypothetical protein
MLTTNLIKKYDGTFLANFDPQPDDVLVSIGATLIYNLTGSQTQIKKLTSFKDLVIGETTTRMLERQYSFSTDNINFSNYVNIGDFSEFVELSGDTLFYLRLKYKRIGTDTSGSITIQNAVFSGEWAVPESYTLVELSNIDECQKLKHADTFKVFKLTGFNLYSSGTSATRILEIKYRFTQNNGRSWSNWENLTVENISTIKNDPLKFFNIEYVACRRGTDTSGVIKLHDIELLGDFQNVSNNYTKSNKFGIRSCCSGDNSTASGGTGSLNPDGSLGFSSFTNCNFPEDVLNAECDGSNFNPYQAGSATTLYNFLSNSVVKPFGWEANYFKTDADEKGIDREFHEYQLYNVCGAADIKVMVPENQFPDTQINFNQFDLSLFETFEIHITKDEFKKAFGLETRPAKTDFMFLCITNRMYEVEHAQAYKDFLNSSTYYKVILKKWNNKANVRHLSADTKNAVEMLTNNSSLEEIFGLSNRDEDNRIVKKQLSPQSFDKIRRVILPQVKIVKNQIVNASLLLSESYYNLSFVNLGQTAIDYYVADTKVLKGDNRSFMVWFKLPIIPNLTDVYSFLDNYDLLTTKGYAMWYQNLAVHFKLNGVQYDLPTIGILPNVWYCYVINLNQRLNYVQQEIYQRDTVIDINGNETGAEILNTSSLILQWSQVWEGTTPEEFEHSQRMQIFGSNIYLTNIRLFTDVIPKSAYTKVLNQQIVKSSDFLIFADNTDARIVLPNHV